MISTDHLDADLIWAWATFGFATNAYCVFKRYMKYGRCSRSFESFGGRTNWSMYEGIELSVK